MPKLIKHNFEKDKTVYIVDINYYIHSGHHGVRLTSRGVSIGGTFTTVKNLLRLSKMGKYIVAAVDDSYSFRKEQCDAAYKKDRKKNPEIHYQREAVLTFCMAMDIPIVRQHGYEADDVIATLALEYNKRERPVVIVGRDKDLFAMITDEILMFNITSGHWYNREKVIATMGVPPEKIEDFLAIAGDSADGYKGLPGLGAKAAQELLSMYGSTREILANWDKLPQKYKNRINNGPALESFRKSIFLSRLERNVPNLQRYYNPPEFNINKDKYNELCEFHGFNSLLIKD